MRGSNALQYIRLYQTLTPSVSVNTFRCVQVDGKYRTAILNLKSLTRHLDCQYFQASNTFCGEPVYNLVAHIFHKPQTALQYMPREHFSTLLSCKTFLQNLWPRLTQIVCGSTEY